MSFLLMSMGFLLFLGAVNAVLHESQSTVLPLKISLAEPNYFAIRQNDQCLGSMKVEWKQQPDGSSLFLTGFLSNHTPADIPFVQGELSFNQFNQFFGSVIEFPRLKQMPGKHLKVGSHGVTPINIIVSGQLFDKPLSLKTSANGPITLLMVKGFGWISVPESKTTLPQGAHPLFSQVKIESIIDETECKQTEQIQNNSPEVLRMLSGLVNRLRVE